MRRSCILPALAVAALLATVVPLMAEEPERGTLVDGIVAVVGDQVITRSELADAMAFKASLLKAKQKAGLAGEEVANRFEELQVEIRSNLVDNKLILQAANDEGMSAGEEVTKRLEKLKERMPDKEELERFLGSQGFDSLADYEARMKEEMLRQRIVFTQVRPKAEVTQKELETEFQKRYGGKAAREAGCEGAYVRVFALEQVRFPLAPNTTVGGLISTYSTAYACYLGLLSGDIAPEEVGVRCVVENLVPQHGSLGEIDETKSFEQSFQAAFEDLIAADAEDKLSEPFILNDGIWVLMVTGQRRECFTDLTELSRLKDRVKARLEDEKFEKVLNWWLKQLRGKYRVDLKPL